MDSAPATDDLERLRAVIDRALPLLAMPEENHPPVYSPPKTPVTETEAAGFFRAIDHGVFDLTDDAYSIPRGLRPSVAYCAPLLDRPLRTEPVVRLWREWLTHAAVVGSLHTDYGYPKHDIAIDVGAFDALVYSPLNQPLIAVEAKKEATELHAMIAKMQAALEDESWVLSVRMPLGNAVKKVRSLLALRPAYFLAVAPGLSLAYSVRYSDDPSTFEANMTEVKRVPTALEESR